MQTAPHITTVILHASNWVEVTVHSIESGRTLAALEAKTVREAKSLIRAHGFSVLGSERIAELMSMGYYIEDMGAVWGKEYAGQFRWVKLNSDDYQGGGTSSSEDWAWESCDWFERNKHRFAS
jgi:hypothetical protein